MRYSIQKILIILTILLYFTTVQSVYAETLEEQLNNLVGPKEQYNTMLSPVYLKTNTINESISPQSGELSIAQTDYVLPGRNGLDLEIKRLYKSNTSNIKEMKVKYESGAWVDYVYSDANTTSFFEERYNLSVGMRFSFPTIEIRKNSDGSSHKFLHTEAGDTYRLKIQNISNGINTYVPENQTIKDVELRDSNEFSNGQSDGVSKYVMEGKDGKKTYFTEDGRVVGIVDRYKNTIKFEYASLTYVIDGVSKTKRLINKITDTVGRIITIEYKEDYTYTVIPIENNSYSAEESYKESQNPNTTDSGDLKEKFQVVINLPGDKRLIYDKSAALVSNTKHVIRTRLQKVIDIDGKTKYHYWYDQPELGFTYANGTHYAVYNRYENLTQIDYCKTNRVTRYIYEKYTKGLADSGSMQYQKIFEKRELIKKGYDPSITQFLDRFSYDVKDKISYKYENEADGFGYNGYEENNEYYLKNIYKYKTLKTDLAGTITKYTYNGIHELINTEEAGNDHKEEAYTEYDEMKFPKKKEQAIFNLQTGAIVKKIENYRYDEYGNLTNYTGPLAARDENGYPSDSEHTVIYSYAYDKYHVLTLKTWKQDKDTTSQIIFDVNNLGQIVTEKKVHTSDIGEWLVTNYEYDTYGNIVKKTVNSKDNTYITNYEYGIDEDGVDHKGAYLTKEYSIIDGVETAKKYTYDFNNGNKKSERNENDNKTSYEYDVLSRLVKVVYPDTTEKNYSYNDYLFSNKEINYTDPKGTTFKYEYDIQGNQVKSSVFNKDTWNVLKSTEYDFKGNKTKETDANGQSIVFTYDSAGRLKEKIFYEKTAESGDIRRESIKLDYYIGYDELTPLLIVSTDEEDYEKKYYYDISDRLWKSEVTSDNNNFYKTLYTYDYIGNKTSITDARNNTTKFIYDDIGRLWKKIDVYENETIYEYNSLSKALSIEEPGNRITQYIYDKLGRVNEQRIYEKGSLDYTCTKFNYDNAGNVLLMQQGSLLNGIKNISSETSYHYNNMNRVDEEYRKIDSTKTAQINYSYDANGNKNEVKEYIDEEKTKFLLYTYGYDYAGRLVFEEGVYKEPDSYDNYIEHGHYLKKYDIDYAGNIKNQYQFDGIEYKATSYSYDYRNRLLSKTEPYSNDGLFKTTSYTYSRKGNLESETITRQGITATAYYQYNGMDNLVKKTDAKGNISRYIYDNVGNLIKEINPRYMNKTVETAPGFVHEYDNLNRRFRTSVYDGFSTEVISYTEFDVRGNIIKEVDGEGYNYSDPTKSIGNLFEYDVSNNVIAYTSAQTVKDNLLKGTHYTTRKYSYDGSGRTVSEVDALGAVKEYIYFLNGKLWKVIYPDNISEEYQYDLTGKVLVEKADRRGNKTSTFLNIFGKPYRIEYPDETYDEFVYGYKGELKESYDRSGNVKNYDYDPSGNLIEKKEYIYEDSFYKYFRISKYTYDETNNVLSSETFEYRESNVDGIQEELISSGDKTEYVYDENGRQIIIKGPNEREIINEFNKKGNLITKKQKVTDDNYEIKRFEYDVQSRLVKDSLLVEASSLDLDRLSSIEFDVEFGTRVKASNKYSYYKNGQLKVLEDANGNETKYTYNLDKKPIQKEDAKKNSMFYVYDLTGNLVEERNTREISTFYDYDKLGRLIRKRIPAADGGQAVTRYIYNPNGNLEKEILPNDYEAAKDTDALVSTMKGKTYVYDSMNGRVSTTSSDGNLLEYIQYDRNGNIKKVVDGLRFNGNIDNSLGTVYSYDALNRVVQKKDAMDYKTSYEYNVLNHIIKQVDAMENPTSYEYAADGTLKRIEFANKGFIDYTYDKIGRKTSQTYQRGNTSTYSYNALGKLALEEDPYKKTVEYKYDLNGNLTSVKDKRGYTSFYYYDENKRLIEKKQPVNKDDGGNISFSIEKYYYDSEGNIKSKTSTGTKDKLAVREVYYTYYNNNLLDTVTDNGGSYLKNYYDKNGNIVKTELLRENGEYDILKYEYDSQNRLVKNIKLIDKSDLFDAEKLSNIESLRDSEYSGKVMLITGYEYNILGNKVKEISPAAYGFSESDTVNRSKFTVTFEYNLLNRLEKIIRKYNGTDVYIQYTYDGLGNRVVERNERGLETKYSYNNINKLETITDPYENTFAYGYDLAGNKVTETNAKQDTITYGYDKLNRLEMVTDPYGTIITKNIYDENGNVIKSIDAKGYLSGSSDEERYGTLYAYDLANWLVKVVDPELAAQNDPEKYTVRYEYNQFGEKVKEKDALGNTTAYEYSVTGKLLKVINGTVTSVSYDYDKAGNKRFMVDGRSKTTTYNYGAFGILRSVIDADNKEISYKYDFSGNVVSILDRNGNTTVYSYDNWNQLTGKRVVETGDAISYSYDEAGNRQSMTDESGTRIYDYDRNNRLLEIRKDGMAQISYSYDVIGNIETVTDIKGYVTTYTYDRSSRMYTVLANGALIASYTYDKNGNRETITYNNGILESYEYDRNNRLKELFNKKPDGSIISKYSYTYYDNGLQHTKTDSYGTTTYSYDTMGRVLKIEAPGKTTVYAYDLAGNRKSQNETYTSAQPSGYVEDATGIEIKYIIKKSEYTYSNTNRLMNLVEKMYDAAGKEILQKTVSYIFDDNGNELRQSTSYIHPHNIMMRQVTKKQVTGDSITGEIDDLIEKVYNTFDGFNRLKKAVNIKAGVRSTTEYTYTGDDLRVRKVVKSSDKDYAEEVTNYLYDRQHVILETDGSDAVQVRYIRGINYIARTGPSGALSYYLYNGHGDVVQTVSARGEVENEYDYDIWGNPTLTIQQYENAIRYSGEFFDSETGLYYLRARYYNPYIGRFISEDSYWGEDSNPLSLNLYTYAHNDPIQYIDPTGHAAVNLMVNSKQVESAIINDSTNRTEANLREVGELLGGNIGWDEGSGVATVSVGNKKIEFDTSRGKAKLNGEDINIGFYMDENEGRIKVEVRTLAESLGANVGWNPNEGGVADVTVTSEEEKKVTMYSMGDGSNMYNNEEFMVPGSEVPMWEKVRWSSKEPTMDRYYNIFTGVPYGVDEDNPDGAEINSYYANTVLLQGTGWNTPVTEGNGWTNKKPDMTVIYNVKTLRRAEVNEYRAKTLVATGEWRNERPLSHQEKRQLRLENEFHVDPSEGKGIIETPSSNIEPKGTGKSDYGITEGFAYEWTGNHVTLEFKTKVLEISKKLQMNPDDLMAMMAFESEGINPAAVNPVSGATGLIQFMPSTARRLGTSTEALAQMSAVEQLDYVYEYFKPYAGKIHDISDAYMVVFMPIAVGQGNDYVLGVKGSNNIFYQNVSYGLVYEQNTVLDYDGDGTIYKWEAAQQVIDTRSRYKKIN